MANPLSNGYIAGTPAWVVPYIEAASQQYGVPTLLLSAQLNQESGFNPHAVSSANAEGIAQFLPSTAQGYGIDPWNPQQAIQGQAHYMHDLYNQLGHNWDLALAGYNAGAGAVQGGYWQGIPQTSDYVKSIDAMMGAGWRPSSYAPSVQPPINPNHFRSYQPPASSYTPPPVPAPRPLPAPRPVAPPVHPPLPAFHPALQRLQALKEQDLQNRLGGSPQSYGYGYYNSPTSAPSAPSAPQNPTPNAQTANLYSGTNSAHGVQVG